MTSDDKRIRATYRVQLRPDFDLDALVEVVPYLAELGISHVYCSSYLQSAPGSPHGYDVVDHTRINDELGGPAALQRLSTALSRHGMGQVLDVIPNHMAIGSRASKWWWDVLKNGPDSPFARFFDIDWNPPDTRLAGKILVPILGDHYGRVLEAGELHLAESFGELVVRYFEHEVPLAPGSLEQLPGSGSIAGINREPALLHLVLEAQHFRLAYWRTDLELNYRRFFDINDLVALRVEEPEVFDNVHKVALELVAEDRLDGLRIDHIDGLKNPGRYLHDLRDRAPDTYIVVEKILGHDEVLPEWPVEGTTGYDFLNRAGSLLLDPDGEKPLSDLYTTFTGEISELGALTRELKMKIMDELLASDVERLIALLAGVCERHPRHRDYTRHDLRRAVRAVISELGVYRTYVDAEAKSLRGDDARVIDTAIAGARENNRELDADLFDFLAGLLLARLEGGPEAEFVMRWQQTTGPVMAKAVEDTLFYNYNRFVALNEVGGDPGLWGCSPDEFHAAMRAAFERWPRTMLATSTHDTKRSEDVRARLLVLAEMPEAWAVAVRKWSTNNERYKESGFPDRNAEYLLYQSLVGAHPLDVERAVAYLHKAANEAKRLTSWIAPDSDYDRILEQFVRRVLADRAFMSSLQEFVDSIEAAAHAKSLAMVLLKLTCPGVPDIYQGTEVWEHSLVDPDNRRPVDYDARRSLLRSVQSATPENVWDLDAGAPKLFLIHRALGLRRRLPEVFGPHGTYAELPVEGPGGDGVVAFTRSGRVAVVVPRFTLGDPPEAVVRLQPGRWDHVLGSGDHSGAVPVAELVAGWPVALLELAEAP